MFYASPEFSYDKIKEFINTVDKGDYELLTEKKDYNRSSKSQLNIKHKCGNIFKVQCYHFIKNNNRCPMCNKAKYFKTKTHDEFVQDVFNACGDEYTVKGKYVNKSTKIDLLHNKCGNIYTVTPGHFLNTGCRCTFCGQKSRGERYSSEILTEMSINFSKEYRFKDLYNDEKTNRLEFDFAVFNKNDKLLFLVEYQGPQHERPVIYGNITTEEAEKRFKKQLRNDFLKKEFCQKYNIPLFFIQYTSRSKKQIREKLVQFLERLNDYPETEYTKKLDF